MPGKKKYRRLESFRFREARRKNRRSRHPFLTPGMILQFRADPTEAIKADEWIFDSGCRLFQGDIPAEQLQYYISGHEHAGEEEAILPRSQVLEMEVYNAHALLVKIQKVTQGYFFQVLVGQKLCWAHESDFQGL